MKHLDLEVLENRISKREKRITDAGILTSLLLLISILTMIIVYGVL